MLSTKIVPNPLHPTIVIAMRKHMFILTVIPILLGCTRVKPSFNIHPLPPFRYEFKDNKGRTNEIRYFYLDGDFDYNKDAYNTLKVAILPSEQIDTAIYLSSVYIYHKTAELNGSYNQGRASLDGHSEDLVAYVRYRDRQPDIFYIIRKGNVVFDNIGQDKMNFPFDQ